MKYTYIEDIEAFDDDLNDVSLKLKEILLLLSVSPLNSEKRRYLLSSLNEISRNILKGNRRHALRRLAGYKGYLMRVMR